MKNYSQVAYSALSLRLFAFLLLLTHTLAAFTFRAVPDPAVVGQLCTLSCRGKSAHGLQIIIYGVFDSEVHGIFPKPSHNPSIHRRWRADNEVQVIHDRSRGILDVKFTARRDDQDRLVKCLSEDYQEDEDGYQVRDLFIELRVEKFPSVLDLYMTDSNGNRINFATPDSIIFIVCRIELGVPESEDYNIVAPGKLQSRLGEPFDYSEDNYGYKKASIQLNTRVSYEEDGEPIVCTVSNRHHRARRVMVMRVL